MKNTYIGIGLILVIFVIGYVLLQNDSSVVVYVQTITEKTEAYEIYAEYPRFPKAKKQFNEEIKTHLVNLIETFKGEISRFDDLEKDVYTFSSSWESIQMSDDMLSIILRTSYYTGGVHGGRDIATFTYDMKDDRMIALNDVFSLTPDYLEKISRYTISDLKTQLSQEEGNEVNIDMIVDGASPQIENFSRFTVSRDGYVTFYFPEYQVAPYALGEQKVVMPISFIQ